MKERKNRLLLAFIILAMALLWVSVSSADIVAEGLGGDQAEAVLFTYMLKLYSYVISHFENYINYTAYDCQGI